MISKVHATLKVGTIEYSLRLKDEEIDEIVSKYGRRKYEALEAVMEDGWNKNAVKETKK